MLQGDISIWHPHMRLIPRTKAIGSLWKLRQCVRRSHKTIHAVFDSNNLFHLRMIYTIKYSDMIDCFTVVCFIGKSRSLVLRSQNSVLIVSEYCCIVWLVSDYAESLGACYYIGVCADDGKVNWNQSTGEAKSVYVVASTCGKNLLCHFQCF